MSSEGIIYDIQRYCIHDGPGIRSTVFFKGCPLDCWWCHNPESKKPSQQIIFWPDQCIGCGRCRDACPDEVAVGAAGAAEECEMCAECTQVCPTEAVELIGEKMTASEVLGEIQKDAVFYEESGGGVTFSGGEPLLQHDFLLELLRLCKKKGIHTAVDTCGYAEWDILKQISSAADLILYDVKIMDSGEHEKYTGVSNKIILQNLHRLVEHRSTENIIARFPLIPGINDDIQHAEQLGELLSSLKISKMNILPYHRAATEKHARLHDDYRLQDITPPSDDEVSTISKIIEEYGVRVEIGG